MKTWRFTALAFAILLVMCVPVVHIKATPVRVNLTELQKSELNDYFLKFAQGSLGDYDVEDFTKSKDIALRFAVLYAIHVDGRGSATYVNGLVVNTADYGMESLGEVDMFGFPVEYEYTSASKVDALSFEFFGIQGIEHQTIITDIWYDIIFENDRYYMPIADGEQTSVPNVIEYHDNGNGTYSARIENTLYIEGEVYSKSSIIAVIQPYNGTYQLLYWKNNAGNSEQIPLREPLKNIADEAEIISFTSRNNQTEFNLDETIYLTVKTNLEVTHVRYEYRDNGEWKYDELFATIPNSSTQTEKTWTTNFALTHATIDAVRVIASNEYSEDIKVIDVAVISSEGGDKWLDEMLDISDNTRSTGGVSVIFFASDMQNQAIIRAGIYTEKYGGFHQIVIINSAVEFISGWNTTFSHFNRQGTAINAIEIISHGGADGPPFIRNEDGTAQATGYLYFTSDNRYNRLFARNLPTYMNDGDRTLDGINVRVTAREININGCNSANPDVYNVVYGFMQITSAQTYSGFDGGSAWDASARDHVRGYGEYGTTLKHPFDATYYVIKYQETYWRYVAKYLDGSPARERVGRRTFLR